MKELIIKEIENSINTKKRILLDDNIITNINRIVNKCIYSLENNGKIIFCGNGGSFADSQHLAAEFISRLRFDRDSLASIALGTNSSNLSAIGNDYGFKYVFSREISSIGKKQDVFIPISTSGKSLNVIEAIKTAKKKGITCFGFTGRDGGEMKNIIDCIVIPSESTEKIQECHIMIGHIICYLVEKKLFEK